MQCFGEIINSADEFTNQIMAAVPVPVIYSNLQRIKMHSSTKTITGKDRKEK